MRARGRLVLLGVAAVACARPPATPRAVRTDVPATDASPIVVLEAGAAPRRELRYGGAAVTHVVALTVNGSSQSSGSSCLGSMSFASILDEVKLAGTFSTAPGRAILALTTGTATDRGNVFFARAPVDVAGQLPFRFDLALDGAHVTSLPSAAPADRYQRALLDALPALPPTPIGAGARWQSTRTVDDTTVVATWTLTSIEDDEIAITGSIREMPTVHSESYFASTDVTVQATIDLATLTLLADTTRVSRYSSHQGLGSGSGSSAIHTVLHIGSRRAE